MPKRFFNIFLLEFRRLNIDNDGFEARKKNVKAKLFVGDIW
jgi:hypothetical protein